MKSINVPASAQQVSNIGFSKDFSQGICPEEVVGFIRIKNIGEEDGRLRKKSQVEAEGIVLSAGETEYFYIEPDDRLEILSGQFNIMY